MTPVATLANATATGDVVVGPGCPIRLANCMPIACLGDAVAGAAVTGSITMTTAPTRIVGGRPVANLGSVVVGVNPVTGIPMTTALAVCPAVNRIY